MYSSAEECHLEIQCRSLRSFGHVMEITCKEVVQTSPRQEEFPFGRDKQKAIVTGMATFGILGDVAGREARMNMIAVWRIGVRGTTRFPAMSVIQITRETGDSWIN